MTNSGEFQLELNRAYSKKMMLELTIRTLRKINSSNEPMLEGVQNALMEEAVTELKEVEEFIEMLWSASEMSRDELIEVNHNLRMSTLSIALSEIPF